MPCYIASGSFTDENSGVKYRFLVLPRYDIDLQKIVARTRVLDLRNVLVLGIQILDVLEYLHSQGYTHSDIKSSNLMLGFDGSKVGKFPMVKPPPSFQKETKQLTILTGKQRKAKNGRGRSSNYYDDEDFIIKDHKSGFNSPTEDEKDKKLASVKNKLRKILSDDDSKSYRHHAFNLRQISNYVNYEDFNSSVCSDQSYQKLLDNFENKQRLALTSEDGQDQKRTFKVPETSPDSNYKEAVLSQSTGQIYLLDYGLASKFLDAQGKHKDFGMDARKAHDGTLEYSSRDSHIGAHSRRSDLETLGYNLLDWLTGTLPWKTAEMLTEPDLVHALKKNFMSDVKSLLKTCFKTEFYPQFLEKYLEYVTSLDFTEKPDYDYCRSIFRNELVKNGYLEKDLSLNFAEPPMSPMNRKKLCISKRFGRKNTPADFIAKNGVKKTYERENICSLENDLKLELLKQTLNSSSDGIRKPCSSRNFFISDADLVARLKKSLMPHDVLGKKLSPKNLRSNKRKIQKKKGKKTHRSSSIGKFGNFMGSARQFTWAEILAGNPEHIIRKERNAAASDSEYDDEDTCKYRIRKLSNASSEGSGSDANLQSPLLQKDYLNDMNPTYAMKEIIANLKKRISGKPAKEEDVREGFEGYTPPMIKLYKIKEKREAKEKLELTKQMAKSVPENKPRCTRSKKTKTVTSSSQTTIRTTRNRPQMPEAKVVVTKVQSDKKQKLTVDKGKEANIKAKCNSRKVSEKTKNIKKGTKAEVEEVKTVDSTKTPPKKTSTYTFYTFYNVFPYIFATNLFQTRVLCLYYTNSS